MVSTGTIATPIFSKTHTQDAMHTQNIYKSCGECQIEILAIAYFLMFVQGLFECHLISKCFIKTLTYNPTTIGQLSMNYLLSTWFIM